MLLLPQTEQVSRTIQVGVRSFPTHRMLCGKWICNCLLDPKLISNLFGTVSSRYEELKGNFLSSNPSNNFSSASKGVCREIVSEIERSSLFYDIIHSESLLNCLEKIWA